MFIILLLFILELAACVIYWKIRRQSFQDTYAAISYQFCTL